MHLNRLPPPSPLLLSQHSSVKSPQRQPSTGNSDAATPFPFCCGAAVLSLDIAAAAVAAAARLPSAEVYERSEQSGQPVSCDPPSFYCPND